MHKHLLVENYILSSFVQARDEKKLSKFSSAFLLKHILCDTPLSMLRQYNNIQKSCTNKQTMKQTANSTNAAYKTTWDGLGLLSVLSAFGHS